MENKTYGPDTPPKEAAAFLAEHIGEECRFGDSSRCTETPGPISGIRVKEGGILFYHSGGMPFQFCRLKPKPKRKLWDAVSCPSNLEIRQSEWVEGVCYSVSAIYSEGLEVPDNAPNTLIGWQQLADEWEQRDGSACYDLEGGE
jgi:hypothetical protein